MDEVKAAAPLSLDAVWQQYPGLHFFEGISGLVYCSLPLSSPPIVFRATSAEGLALQIEDYKRNGPPWKRSGDQS